MVFVTNTQVFANPRDDAEAHWLEDLDADNSAKILTVPAGRIYRVQFLRYQLTATATVGTRTPQIEFRDPADAVLFSVAGPTVTASGSSTQSADPGGLLDLTLPEQFDLLPGFDIRVWDSAAIDAAADDLSVWALVSGVFVR